CCRVSFFTILSSFLFSFLSPSRRRPPPSSTLFPYTTLFRSVPARGDPRQGQGHGVPLLRRERRGTRVSPPLRCDRRIARDWTAWAGTRGDVACRGGTQGAAVPDARGRHRRDPAARCRLFEQARSCASPRGAPQGAGSRPK